MRIGILGKGAVGISIAYELYKVIPNDLYFLETNRNIDGHIKVNGHSETIKTTKSLIMDYVIICVKNYDLDNSILKLDKFIDSKTVILPLLNGIKAHDKIKAKYINNLVLYGIIKIEANRNQDNEVYNGGILDIQFGDRFNNNLIKEVKVLHELFDEALIVNHVPEDMQRAVWLKWMLNMGINQVSALTNSTYNDMQHPYLQELLYNIFMEVITVAKAYQIDLREDDARNMIVASHAWTSDRYTSLTLDIQNKRRNELDDFSGELLRLAKEKNIVLYNNEFIYKCLKSISDNYLGGKKYD